MAPWLFVKAAFAEKEIRVFNHGNQKRDFTYIDDIVEGVFQCVLQFSKVQGAEIFNIGNGSPVGLMSFISSIELATGRPLNKKFVEAQVGDVEITFADVTKFRNTFGYTPRMKLHDGVAKFVEWYATHYESTFN